MSTTTTGLRARQTPRPVTDMTVGMVGLGYVGLPTALALNAAGVPVIGFDISPQRIDEIRRRDVDVTATDNERLTRALQDGGLPFVLTDRAQTLQSADAIIIAVPTPVDEHHVPDLRALRGACQTVCEQARAGQTIILTSTTYVGCTRELLVAPLALRGFGVGTDVFVAFSPERIDPGMNAVPQEQVPRVLGGVSDACCERAQMVIGSVAPVVYCVSSPEAAEMTKLFENTFRAANITLANELADACRALSLSPREVIDAAATKPYGFMAFNPGPGAGGHCIPCDPHYLLWQLRRQSVHLPLISEAMTNIAARPYRVADRCAEVLSREGGIGLHGARVLLVGVSYKPGVRDIRESSALVLLRELRRRGAEMSYYDPAVPVCDEGGDTLISVAEPSASDYDLIVLHTIHPERDYGFLGEAWPILDCTYRHQGRKVEL
jgi:UDP-N-acetyl-D-glucosamine dehydrogenase